jgi:2,3-bisphosphoglycerate-independent phosphoglycerate mutase
VAGPVALVILDGWGLAPPGPGNAVHLAATPAMDRLWAECPHTELSASGADVGLPEGQMGNSEVGHLNLGAGRVVIQSLTRIDRAIADGSFFANPALRDACAAARGRRLHILGLASDGCVHSSLGHMEALLELAAREGLPADAVCVHAFTDGRDTAPGSAPEFLARLEAAMRRHGVGRFASLAGRYYAMDRDRHWERTRAAFGALCGEGPRAPDWRAALAAAAARRAPNGDGPETDEFLLPTAIGDGAVREGDSVIMANWRADRVRQLTAALTDPGFGAFPRPWRRVAAFCGMGPYGEAHPLPAAFPGMEVPDPLGAVVGAAGLGQARVAETEKYAHVTYFLNGGREEPFPGERRVLVPSPRVATYDLRPEMSASEVAARAAEALADPGTALLVVNFANPDMVGHTGVLPAAVLACEAADRGLARVLSALEARGGAALVLADHGNAEVMVDPLHGAPHTAHTTNPVPCVLAGRPGLRLRAGGRLCDVAPTLLRLLELPIPPAMTGRSLIAEEA